MGQKSLALNNSLQIAGGMSGHHHHHSLFTHYVLIYNSAMNKVIGRSYREKNRNSRNTCR